MEILTSFDEIIDTLKKLKDAHPAGFHHQDIVKQDLVTVTIETNVPQGEAVVKEQVVMLPATIETNFWQGDLETKVDGTKGDVSETETEINETRCQSGRRVESLISDQNGLWFASSGCKIIWTRDDLENIYMLQEELGREWLALRASQTLQDSCLEVRSAHWAVVCLRKRHVLSVEARFVGNGFQLEALQRGRRSRARHHRFRAVVGAVRPRRAL